MRRLRRLRSLVATTAVLVALPLASACGDDSTSPSDIAGTYALQTINGAALPVTVPTGFGLSYSVSAGTVVLERGGTLNGSFTALASGAPSPATFTFAGTWSNDDDRVTITIPDLGSSGNITATHSGGNTLTFTAQLFAGTPAQTMVFRR